MELEGKGEPGISGASGGGRLHYQLVTRLPEGACEEHFCFYIGLVTNRSLKSLLSRVRQHASGSHGDERGPCYLVGTGRSYGLPQSNVEDDGMCTVPATEPLPGVK